MNTTRAGVPLGLALLGVLALGCCGTASNGAAELPAIAGSRTEPANAPAASPAPSQARVSSQPAPAPPSAPPSAPQTAPSASTTESPVPLAPVRQPAEFVGSDEEFVRQVRDNLEQDKVDSDLSDAKLLTLGREFCSVLSGGGLLTDKVDYWAGLRDLDSGSDTAVILAAQEVYCRDLTDGYSRLQLGEARTVPSPAERADLARFVTALDEPDLAARLRARPDADIAEDAETACDIDFTGEWWGRPKAKRAADALPDGLQMDYVVGLVTAYCSKRADEMIDSLREFAR